MHAGPSNTDFLDWLRSTLADALKASLQHESLKKVVRELRASIEGKFGLVTVKVCQHRPPNIKLVCNAAVKLVRGSLALALAAEQ